MLQQVLFVMYEGARNEIFAMQPAPVQVSYMGFPGTTGATYIDYLVTDEGGMSNELYNTIARVTNGIYEGIAIPMAPQAINNPAPPTGGIPITPPVSTPTQNPVTHPAGINPPTTPSGQVWCVAKTGVPQTALQVALDYACGMGGADCSAIQQSGSCYNPNTPQNHASYAFNSYYQKHPAPSSCDFKGAATLVIANPSTGSCIYPSPSLSSSSPSPPSLSAPLLPPPSVSPPATTISSPPPATTSPSLQA